MQVGLEISQLFSIAATLTVFLVLWLGFDKWYICKLIVISVDDLLASIVLQTGDKKWKPLLMAIFYFIVINNVLSCIGFAALNKIMVVPMLLSGIVTISALIVGVKKKGINVALDLIPKSTPLLIKPLIFLIELISILSKPFTLFFRLFLNVVISHYIVEILHGLTRGLSGVQFTIYSPFITIILTALNIMEIFISILQAFIFVNFSSLLIANLTGSH